MDGSVVKMYIKKKKTGMQTSQQDGGKKTHFVRKRQRRRLSSFAAEPFFFLTQALGLRRTASLCSRLLPPDAVLNPLSL